MQIQSIFSTLFSNDDLLNKTIEEINNFYENSQREKPSSSKSAKFMPIDVAKMKGFLGLIIQKGIIKKPNLKMYISMNEMLTIPFFNRVMSQDVFLTAFHF